MPKYATFGDAVDAIIDAMGSGQSTDLTPVLNKCDQINTSVKAVDTKVANVQTVVDDSSAKISDLHNYFELGTSE